MSHLLAKLLALPILAPLRHRYANSSEAVRGFFRGVFWTFFGTASRRLLSAISTMAVARILGPEHFGEFVMIQSTAGIFAVYAGFRLGTTATKYVAEFRTKQPTRAARVLKLTLCVSILLCIMAGLLLATTSEVLARNILGNPALSTGLMLSGILVFLTYGEVQQHALAGFENFKAIARVNFVWGIATLVLVAPMAFVWGIEGAIIGLALSGSIALWNTSFALQRETRQNNFPQNIPLSDLKKDLPVLWTFALPGFLIGAVTILATWSAKAFLGHQDNGYLQLGLFGAADQWRAVVLFIPGIIARVMLPILSEIRGREEDNDFARILSLQIKSVMVVALPLICLLMGLANFLIVVYGIQYNAAAPILALLMFSVFFSALNQPLSMVFTAAGARWKNLLMHVVWAFIFVTGSFILIDSMQAFGIAVAIVVSDSILFFMQGLYIDFVLAYRALRYQLVLFLYSMMLLLICYLSRLWLDAEVYLMVVVGLSVAALLPSLRLLLQKTRTQKKV